MAKKDAAATEAETTQSEDNAAPKVVKSIVPSKYAGKYKGGGEGAVSEFIKEQVTGKDGFEWPGFYQLCTANGVDQAKIDHYKGLIEAKAHGAQGRARMTLRNLLEGRIRKNGGTATKLDGSSVTIELPKRAASGAAKAAAEATADAA